MDFLCDLSDIISRRHVVESFTFCVEIIARRLRLDPGGRSVNCTWDDVNAADPDVVIVSPCGYGLIGAIEQSQMVLRYISGRAKVFAIDADSVIVRPGPRLVDGAEAIAAVLHGIGDVPDDIIYKIR